MRHFLTTSLLIVAWLNQPPTGFLWKSSPVAAASTVGRQQSSLQPELSGAVARLWRGQQTEDLPTAIHDGKEDTYIVLTPGKDNPELGVGVEWKSPAKINGLEVHYATLNGAAYEPLPEFQKLQYWDGDQWRVLDSTLRIDYGPEHELAPYQGSGWVSWNYQFKPVEARGVRVLLSKTPSQIPWRQRYVVREFKPFISAAGTQERARVTVVRQSGQPEPDEAMIIAQGLARRMGMKHKGPIAQKIPSKRRE